MKKNLIIASLLSLSAFLGACSDDKNDVRYCDAGFADKCENGVFLKCESVEGQDYRAIVEFEVIKMGDLNYVCDENDALVAKDIRCESGKIVQTGKTKGDHVCDTEGNIIFCSSGAVTTQKAYCSDNATVYCNKKSDNSGYDITRDRCSSAVCEEYERGDVVVANCFKKENITDGCGDTTVYGSCSDSAALTFCSSKTPEKGKTLRLDCMNINDSSNATCMMIDESWGYDCTALCGKNRTGKDVSFHGRCDGDVLSYCALGDDGSTNYTPYEVDCTENGQVCGLDWSNPTNPVFGCIDKT